LRNSGYTTPFILVTGTLGDVFLLDLPFQLDAQ
jgi:hypothetical protein